MYKALNYIGYWYVLVGKVDAASSLMKFTIIWEWEEDVKELDKEHTHTHTHTHIHTHTVVAVYKKR